ncbi:MAG: hypothetical protein KF764_06615 [Labilithrix sp.]|nr:hypothetical protein [Labilithrix sp.]
MATEGGNEYPRDASDEGHEQPSTVARELRNDHPEETSVPPPSVSRLARTTRPQGATGARGASAGALGISKKPRSSPRCIAALMLDGGTSFVLDSDVQGWGTELRSLFSNTRSGPARIEGAPLRFATARGSATGERLTLHFEHAAFVILDRRTGRIEVQAKAESLWGDGFETWARLWLGWLSFLATGRPCTARTARAIGWRTLRVELCSDFVDLRFRRADAGHFSTKASPQTIEKPPKGARVDTFGRNNDDVETIAFGTRSDRRSLSIHDKTNQLRTVKRVAPEESFYAAVWSRSENFAPGARITRVELRFGSSGLRFRGPKDALKVDLTDPAALLVRANLATVWSAETHRRRLLVPGTSKRARRSNVDSRWRVVQDAAGIEAPPTRLFQDRTVRQLTHAEARRKSERGILREAQTLASLRGEPSSNPRMLERVATLGVRDAAEHVPVHARDAFNAKLAARHAFVVPEAVAARDALVEDLLDDERHDVGEPGPGGPPIPNEDDS